MTTEMAGDVDLDLLPLPLFTLRDGLITAPNAAARELLGDVDTVPLHTLVDEKDLLLLDEWVGEACRLGTATVELVMRRPDGTPAALALRARAVPAETHAADADGPPLHVGVEDRTELVRLERALGALGCTTWGVDASTQMNWRPRMNAAVTGVSDEDARSPFTIDTIHPEDLPRLLGSFQHLLDHPGDVLTGELRAIRPESDSKWFEVSGVAANLLDDPLFESIVLLTRMHHSREDSSALVDDQSAFLSLAALTPVGIVLCDAEGQVRYSNAQAAQLLAGTEPDAETGLVPRDVRDRMSEQPTLQAVSRAALAVDGVHTDIANLTVGDEERRGDLGMGRWARFDARVFHGRNGNPAGTVVTVADVTEDTEARAALHRAQEELWTAANHDHLTGLPNRALFLDRLEQALARERREGHGVAVLYCDLDGFKAVNDRHGHQLGDDVLVELARRFGGVLRDTDTACRMGGDEFVALCEGFTSEEEMVAAGERLVQALSLPVPTSHGGIVVGATVGIAVADGSSTPGGLLSLADRAMYAAKAHGKGQVALAS
ncbi:MAG: diguanylate cyclase [Acidimicrobiia bacterium]|nr:diguanylate cyclase [Acidimicrobiia bacterium]